MLKKLDYHEQLKRQVGFLERSCSNFDAGHQDEAIRIATCIRILIHDTAKSTSLFNHLGATSISLLSTYQLISDNILFTLSVPVRVSNDSGIHAPLDGAPVKILLPVDEWWEQVLVRDGQHDFTRKFVVLAAANKDGGAHVDADLGIEYERLSTDGWTWTQETADKGLERQIVPTHYVLLRQMGYGLLNSPDLLTLCN